jgi:hypothetical protein
VILTTLDDEPQRKCPVNATGPAISAALNCVDHCGGGFRRIQIFSLSSAWDPGYNASQKRAALHRMRIRAAQYVSDGRLRCNSLCGANEVIEKRC